MRDAQGMVPLHVALSTGAAEEVVLKVLEAHGEVATPLSVDVSASYRMVPLDYTPDPFSSMHHPYPATSPAPHAPCCRAMV